MPQMAEQFDQRGDLATALNDLVDFNRRLAAQRKDERDEVQAHLDLIAEGAEVVYSAPDGDVLITTRVPRATWEALRERSRS